jgi:DNA (cytosine-5)-methyltransferase 1
VEAVSLFSGAGGLDWGFHKAGFRVLSALDIKLDAARTYAENFGVKVNPEPVLLEGTYAVGDIGQSRLGYTPKSPPTVLLGGPRAKISPLCGAWRRSVRGPKPFGASSTSSTPGTWRS